MKYIDNIGLAFLNALDVALYRQPPDPASRALAYLTHHFAACIDPDTRKRLLALCEAPPHGSESDTDTAEGSPR